jgi:dolichyl-phosphate beta-glucosyltransferase
MKSEADRKAGLNRAVSIVVPAHNEAAVIVETLDRICEYLEEHHPSSQVLVADDGSDDGTSSLVEENRPRWTGTEVRCLRQNPNRGKGHAVRSGMLAADRPYVAFSDADLSTPIEELALLFSALEDGADIAIGSRAIAGARIEIRQPFYRSLMGKIFNRVMRSITRLGVSDSQCGFKLFPREVAQSIFGRCRIDGFAFDVEALWLARRDGLRVAEVPVRWRNRAESRVQPIVHSPDVARRPARSLAPSQRQMTSVARGG